LFGHAGHLADRVEQHFGRHSLDDVPREVLFVAGVRGVGDAGELIHSRTDNQPHHGPQIEVVLDHSLSTIHADSQERLADRFGQILRRAHRSIEIDRPGRSARYWSYRATVLC
jgi:hypothetical protein